MIAVTLEKQRTVLRMENTVLARDAYAGEQFEELNINVFAGDLFLIRLARFVQASVFGDACAGIVQPLRGTVYFLGRNWYSLSADHANALRGRIGRVFTAGNWINHLSLLENILLPQLYHTRGSTRSTRDEAAELAERFGLPGIPLGLPSDCMEADLRRAACVRAFLGRPLLVLLEEPVTGVVSEIVSPLIHAIRDARDRGAAVIWLTREDAVWNDSSIPATGRYRLTGRKLIQVKT